MATKIFAYMLLATLVMPADSAWGWGAEGHVYVNEVAAEHIPADMPLFLRHAVHELAYLGPEPDRWRENPNFSLKNAQEPDHYIDLERIEWMNPLPAGRYEFYQQLYEKRTLTKDNPDDYLPERVGLQPYIVAEVFGRLKIAFAEYRRKREQRQPTDSIEHTIIFYAGWLGHYVADGSQPLHTTVHYNGWVGPNAKGYTTERGIHSRFEGDYVSHNIKARDMASLVHRPKLLSDPFRNYLGYLKISNSLVETVYQLDKEGGFAGKGSPEAFQFTVHRLAAGSQMLLNLWYTAWLNSKA